MRLRWTEPAYLDLQIICDFVADRDGEEAARRIALKICDGLARSPIFRAKDARVGQRALGSWFSKIFLG